jgi:hypothetical protein
MKITNPFFRRRPAASEAPGATIGATGSLAAVRLAAKPESDRRTFADRLDALCDRLNASYTIKRHDGLGSVVVTLELPLGDLAAATGELISEAIEKLEQKFSLQPEVAR